MGEQARGLIPTCARSALGVLCAVSLGGMLGGATSCKTASDQAPVLVGEGQESALVVQNGGKQVILQGGPNVKLTFAEDGFQLGFVSAISDLSSYDPYWLEYTSDGSVAPPSPDVEWRSPTDFKTTVVDAGHATIGLTYDGALVDVALELTSPGGFKATMTISQTGAEAVAYVRLHAHTAGDATEGFYGLGELEDSVDNRGMLRPMQLEPDGVLESKYNEAHAPIPLLIGSHGWGIFVPDKRVGLFDVARKAQDVVEVTYGTGTTTSKGFVFSLYSEDNPLDVEKHYFDETGYPALPAQWAVGPFIWRNDAQGEAQIRADVTQIRSLKIPTSAMWIDRPYASKIGVFDFDPKTYANPLGMIKAAQDAGLRMGLWHVPYAEMGADPTLMTINMQGYFPVQNSLLFNPWGPPLDFTASGAIAFWKNNLKTYVDAGIEGFKLDYAEDVVPALRNDRNVWKFHDGTDERTAHYDYTRAYHDTYKAALPMDSFLLCRAARWGDQQSATILWPGDMDSSFTKHGEMYTPADGTPVVGVGGLPTTVIQGMSLSVSGFPFFASDTGGYRHSPPDNELYVRWFEQTSLAVVMEVGDGSSQTPWEFNTQNGRTQATLDLYRQYAELHMRLFPYVWTQAVAIAKTGHPIIRPVGLQFPVLAAHPSDEYMLGDDLLVAPVLERGATNRSVTFPPGEWIDWWDGTIFPGQTTATVQAPLEKLPLFIRATGGVAMLRDGVQTLAPVADPKTIDSFAADPGVLSVRMAPRTTAQSNVDVYDGTHIDATQTPASITFNLNAGSLFTKGYLIELVTTRAPTSVSANGSMLTKAASGAALTTATSGWATAPDVGGTLFIKLPPGTTTVTVND
jgi:alpha-D-xyloside xylohydrolase